MRINLNTTTTTQHILDVEFPLYLHDVTYLEHGVEMHKHICVKEREITIIEIYDSPYKLLTNYKTINKPAAYKDSNARDLIIYLIEQNDTEYASNKNIFELAKQKAKNIIKGL